MGSLQTHRHNHPVFGPVNKMDPEIGQDHFQRPTPLHRSPIIVQSLQEVNLEMVVLLFGRGEGGGGG